MHRQDLSLYSHPKEFGRNEVRTHVNSKGKIPSTGKILPRGGSNPQRCIKQDREPNTLPTSYSGPFQAGQGAQHTTNKLFWPLSNKTGSPTHYQQAIVAPFKQDREPNTLPTSYSGPFQAGHPPTHYQQAIPALLKQDILQHTTNKLFWPLSSRTSSNTYQQAIPAPLKQDILQHTTNKLFRPF